MMRLFDWIRTWWDGRVPPRYPVGTKLVSRQGVFGEVIGYTRSGRYKLFSNGHLLRKNPQAVERRWRPV